jgi:hypothetical protein
LEHGSVLFVKGFPLPLTLNLAFLLGCVFDIICGRGSIGGDDGCGVTRLELELWRHVM